MVPRYSILLLFFSFSLATKGAIPGLKIDSLWSKFQTETNDSSKVTLLFEIGKYYLDINPDSTLFFYDKAYNKAINQRISVKYFALKKAKSLQESGKKLRSTSNFDDAYNFHNLALDIYLNQDDKLGAARCYQDIGNIYVSIGNFEEATRSYFSAIEIFQEVNNAIGVADCYNNIGTVYKEQGSYEKAIEYHLMSSHLFESLLNSVEPEKKNAVQRGLSYAYNNIGIVYWYDEKYDKAIDFYQKSLEIKKKIDDLSAIAQGYNNIAIAYCSQDNFEEGINQFQRALEIWEKHGNRNGLALVNGNISHLYIILSDREEVDSIRNNLLQKALFYAQKSLSIAKEIGALPMVSESTNYLKEAYAKLGDYKSAFNHAKSFIGYQSEMFSKEKTMALAEMSTRYETEKKRVELESITKEKEIYKKRVSAQRLIIVLSAGIILVVLFFLFMLIRLLREKRIANEMLMEQNEEILQQKEEIAAQVDEIENQSRILSDKKQKIEQLYQIAVERKNLLEKQKDNIDESIRYAKFIQSAVLPDLESMFGRNGWGKDDYFIMFRPKDIVSGDFYWAVHKADWLVVTVADCTGHGIPGAFMSMLGVSFLNEIVLNNNNIDPASILSQMRAHVVSALKQTTFRGTQRDGMDMSIASINLKTRECTWAGANNPLWLVKSNSPNDYNNIDNAIIEFKPDPMPVATHIKMDGFTNHFIQLNEGDRLFFFTDGYPDQFGGEEGKKFNMYSAFKRLIAETSTLPMKEQGKELESIFDTWKSYKGRGYEQIDDVTILGIKV